MVFDMPACGACRTCEIACSFHHTGEFKPSISSIRILSKEDGLGNRVMIIEENDGQNKACDGCDGLEVPLCVEYCEEKETLNKFIGEIRKNQDRTKC
jgi:Fe-S-cluster-containing hydrogenase component 2